ncbi:hypothetical protein EV182_003316 [Spiromyces aspiralis]|uniref:Uncharacterized protein n=1 Tax=Spiromyces aspiralis TaxID=68401 RepID=A0ACC1HE06_9FUNG|nr:hypothetical protein EV182_003316 [Spiromyces aspiralis]
MLHVDEIPSSDPSVRTFADLGIEPHLLELSALPYIQHYRSFDHLEEGYEPRGYKGYRKKFDPTEFTQHMSTFAMQLAESEFSRNQKTATTYAPGQEIEVAWNRLNHPGGFVRLAMVPFNQSDSWDAFNNNVLKYTCYETNCGPSDPNNNNFGRLNGEGDSRCTTKLTIPEKFAGQAVTIQWIWYGGGNYFAQIDTSFGEYYNCADISVSGKAGSDNNKGSSDHAKRAQSSKPIFEGGDVTYPNTDTCKYWGSNRVGDCNFGDRVPTPKDGDPRSRSLEPCSRGPVKQGKPAGF